MQLKTINPSTEEVIQVYPLYQEERIHALIDAAHISYLAWRTTDFSQRTQRMQNMAKLLRENKKKYAQLMAREMGKPVTAGESEIEKCAWVCEHFAKKAASYLEPRLIHTEMRKTKVCYLPLGVIFSIMPWNFPFWQVFRFAAPAIMAGNAVILKHAPISTGTGNEIAELFLQAGFPEHLFQHFLLDNKLAEIVMAHEKIVGVTLTGSEEAGREVGSKAAKHLKRVVLELGGNDPYVVLADADLDLAAESIVTSRMNNSGQSCIAAKRIIVVNTVLDELTEKILKEVEKYKIGDPMDEDTKLGPMAREDLRQKVHQQVKESVQKGAKLLTGGELPKQKGFYYPPTVLDGVEPGMPAFDDEVFGPVISLISADDEIHAIKLANQSRFGLGAAVFTRDIIRGEEIATHEIQSGSCFVNTFVASDPRVPFGGIKHSGFGRELSQEGILEFVNVKTVSVK
ncbi:NAD-dependent succinate-semialdehyde dehydrogenase [Legionella londiniensis]|uniref:Aldehyde dehydrogenase n=1 Tax=Legionella londiniensis TaxID=45068 RepID=A0A0W0VM78_9GAMM|nr:NAD-dependent succinate-semialdehyde dehydrogenase [Legionella londiniensis]KTD21150.1 aldehyde dehydrogenase [Legionella londiniensis]STX93172.1 aldehyde dehydrogenase [Legionella londiniensis]